MSRTVIAAVDDMFFKSKIRAAAEHLGVDVRFARNSEALLASARETKANLIIVDLHAQKIDPIALATALKSDPELQAIMLGFFSHVQTDLIHETTRRVTIESCRVRPFQRTWPPFLLDSWRP